MRHQILIWPKSIGLLLAAIVYFACVGNALAGDIPARLLFGDVKKPANLKARSIGGYVKGCLQGAKMLPINGPAWQAMRLSRNRNWGHPKLVKYVETLAKDSKEKDGWPGLLIGDLSQPRGGPMISGHRSHQLGLDADIWLMPMPKRTLSRKERENISAKSVLARDKVSVNKKVWKPGHVTLLKRATSYPGVARIFVHPAIKKALCEAAGEDRGWLTKIRPWYGHHYHFHVRMNCPTGSKGCENQNPVGSEDGCGKELTAWLNKVKPRPKKKVVKKPVKKGPTRKRRETQLADLPKACKAVLEHARPKDALFADSVPLPIRKPSSVF